MTDRQELWTKEADDLLDALLSLSSRRDARRFVRDLMTPDEIRMVVERWRVARMLSTGVSYKQIEKSTGLSSRDDSAD